VKWLDDVQGHFAGRPFLTERELMAELDLPLSVHAADLRQALCVFSEEYRIPIGALRRDDPLEWFTAPPTTRNPVAWLFNQAAFEDRLSELRYHSRMTGRRHGSTSQGAVPKTIREYALACLGLSP